MNNRSDPQINDVANKQEWLRTYTALLNGEIDHFPKNFWSQNGREKAQLLLKFFRERQELEREDILEIPNRQLIRRARLGRPLNKCYEGDSVKLITDAFEDLKPHDFRWNSNRKIDWEEVQSLRSFYCTISSIAQYVGCQPSVLKRRAEEEEVDLSRPNDGKSLMQDPVEEVTVFWKEAEKVLAGASSLENLFDELLQNNGWNRTKVGNLINRYEVKKKVGRSGANIGKRTNFEAYKSRLYPSEKFVASHLKASDLQVLDGYGADFIYKETILIEVKKTLGTYNMPKALLQLIYAEDKLGGEYDKRIYAEEIGSLKGKESSYRPYTTFYDIDVYVYDESKNDFVARPMRAGEYG